jgi:hypothetical protein
MFLLFEQALSSPEIQDIKNVAARKTNALLLSHFLPTNINFFYLAKAIIHIFLIKSIF